MKRILATVAAVLLAAAAGYRAARAAAVRGDSQVREADRVQIDELMWTYVRALDTENPDAYAATYTPDGQFGTGAQAVKGRAALRKMIADLRKNGGGEAAKRGAMYHMLLNSYVSFPDATHAHMEAYWLTVFSGNPPKVAVDVAAAGREVDELVKVNGKWLIQTRDVLPKN